MSGDLSFVLNETRAAMRSATANVKGVGLTPEGIDNAPAYFSLVLDSPWMVDTTDADACAGADTAQALAPGAASARAG